MSPHLKFQHFPIAVFIQGALRVGRLLIRIVHVVPAHGPDLDRMGLLLQAPAGDVELMGAGVPDIPVAVIPLPVPVVMEPVPVERALRRRAQPEIVMDIRQVGLVHRVHHHLREVPEQLVLARPPVGRAVREVPDVRPGLDAQAPGQIDVAQPALMEKLDGIPHLLAGAALGAHLDDAVVLPGRLHHLPAFPEIVGNGFLHVHVLPCLAGPHRGQGMPVVGGGHGNGVDVGIVTDPPDIMRGGRGRPVQLLGEPHPVRKQVLVNVHQRGHPGVRHFGESLDVPAAPVPDAHHGHVDAIVGPLGRRAQGSASGGRARGGEAGGDHGASPEKLTTSQIHFSVHSTTRLFLSELQCNY